MPNTSSWTLCSRFGLDTITLVKRLQCRQFSERSLIAALYFSTRFSAASFISSNLVRSLLWLKSASFTVFAIAFPFISHIIYVWNILVVCHQFECAKNIFIKTQVPQILKRIRCVLCTDKKFLCSLQNSHDENDTAGNNCPKPHGASARGEGMPRYNDKSSFPRGTDIIEGAASQQPFCCFETTPLTHIRFFLPRFCCRGI